MSILITLALSLFLYWRYPPLAFLPSVIYLIIRLDQALERINVLEYLIKKSSSNTIQLEAVKPLESPLIRPLSKPSILLKCKACEQPEAQFTGA